MSQQFPNSDRAVLLHLSQLLSWVAPFPFAGVIALLIIWQVSKADHRLDCHGRNAVNWVISSTIYSVVLPLTVVGLLLLPILIALNVVFPIVAAVKASQGKLWQYPLSLNVLGRRSKIALRRAAIAFLSLGIFPLAALSGSALWAQHRSGWLASLSPAQGTVTDVVEDTNSEGEVFYQPIITFETAAEETYRMSPVWHSGQPNYVEGEEVNILYVADKPQTAIVDNWTEKWLFVAIAVAVSGVLLVVSLLPSLACIVLDISGRT